MSETSAVFLLLACRKLFRSLWWITILPSICFMIPGCKMSPASSPVGLWRRSGYPSSPAQKQVLLQIQGNGEYFYSKLPGRGTWEFRNDILLLNSFPGAKREELTLQDQPKMLRNVETDGVDFVPASEEVLKPSN